ncbi:MAG TPA: fimbrillin family protein [Prevotella sp.]
MKITSNIIRQHAHKMALALTCMASLAIASCTSDDDFANNNNDSGTAIAFNVSEAQDEVQTVSPHVAAGMLLTRAAFADQLGTINLTPDDLAFRKLPAEGGDGNTCLIESTTPGIESVQRNAEATDTRANITTIDKLGHFSSYGYRGTGASAISTAPDWFYNKETNNDGTLVDPVYWSWSANHFGKFYAVYPQVSTSYDKLTVSPASHAGTPYVDFEVEPDVKNQKDLMTACSGVVEYRVQGVPPTTSLRFRHALTAVRFKVGQNLSWNKTITKVEIVGAMSKGHYVLSTNETGTDAAWSSQNTPSTFTLSDLNINTKQAVNHIIMGNAGDNFTFYMIPQTLTGKNIAVKIYFDNNHTTPDITATLKGEWKAGTTKTYALSQNTSTWDYQLEVTSPAAVAYDQTKTGNYTVKSYRRAPDGTEQPVEWKVVGYDNNNDNTFDMAEKPAWLTSLSMETGNGGTSAKTGTATLTKDIVDFLAKRNKQLKDAKAKGSAGDYYDLSTHGNTKPRSTANCYVISAPGHYCIPLVYGNAITDGAINEHSYKTTVTGLHVLQNFRDHDDQIITDPWIEKTNGNANNGIDGAKIVWGDEENLVHLNSTPIVRSGDETYLQFEVKADDIQNGNAVIAVTKNGTVVWSWHLWFVPQDVLETTEVTNFQNEKYKFTNETLGAKYTTWNASAYSSPRSVRVKIEQTIANSGTRQSGVITITQNNGSVHKGYSTLYQFGRKDAMPGTDAILQGTFNKNGGDNMSIRNGIQHPETFYNSGDSWTKDPPTGFFYHNLWSADNTNIDYNDNAVVKTVYDPCPAGFKLPASNAFTGFTTTGSNVKTTTQFNVSGNWDSGWNFNNKIANPDATLYFLASGYRYRKDGSLAHMNHDAYYWTAIPDHTIGGSCIEFSQWGIQPHSGYNRPYGFSVRPVAD